MFSKISKINNPFVVTKVLLPLSLSYVTCYYKTSFNYGGKKARDVGLSARCHLSSIVPDSIVSDSM